VIFVTAFASYPCPHRESSSLVVEKTFRELAQMAVSEAVHDTGIHMQEVDFGVAGIYNTFRVPGHS
jgi:hypothetical protein